MRIINLSVLSLIALITSTVAESTTVGLETAESSRAVQAGIGECHEIDEEDVYTVVVSRECRFFRGPFCTGRTTLLMPGEHSSKDPVHIGSVYCEKEKSPF